MKALSYIGLGLSLVGIIVVFYAYVTVIPAELTLRNSENRLFWRNAHDLKSLVGYILICCGALGLILSAIPFFKTKSKIALTGLILSVVVAVYWMVAFTHMF